MFTDSRVVGSYRPIPRRSDDGVGPIRAEFELNNLGTISQFSQDVLANHPYFRHGYLYTSQIPDTMDFRSEITGVHFPDGCLVYPLQVEYSSSDEYFYGINPIGALPAYETMQGDWQSNSVLLPADRIMIIHTPTITLPVDALTWTVDVELTVEEGFWDEPPDGVYKATLTQINDAFVINVVPVLDANANPIPELAAVHVWYNVWSERMIPIYIDPWGGDKSFDVSLTIRAATNSGESVNMDTIIRTTIMLDAEPQD